MPPAADFHFFSRCTVFLLARPGRRALSLAGQVLWATARAQRPPEHRRQVMTGASVELRILSAGCALQGRVRITYPSAKTESGSGVSQGPRVLEWQTCDARS